MIPLQTRLRIVTLMCRLAQRLAPDTVRQIPVRCLQELTVYRRHLEAVSVARELVAGKEQLQLELGGGSNSKIGWINVDLYAKDGLALDLRRPLPFPDESVDSIYSEHVLEHFTYLELKSLLSECYRVLKPGGIFQAGVPDAGLAFRAYSADPAVFYQLKYWSNVDPQSLKLPMDEVNWLIYMGEVHHSVFDRQNIVMRLEEVGFTNVSIRSFDSRLDSEFRKHQTMYVVVGKPTGESQSPPSVLAAHIKQIIDDMAASPLLRELTDRLTKQQRYRVLRTLMLVAGRWGKVLVMGDEIEPFMEALSILSVPGADCLCALTNVAERITATTGENRDVGIQSHHRLTISYPEETFMQAIIKRDERLSHDLQAEIHRVLKPGGRLFWITSGDRTVSYLDGFSRIHSEKLPSDAGELYLFERQE